MTLFAWIVIVFILVVACIVAIGLSWSNPQRRAPPRQIKGAAQRFIERNG